MSNADNIRRILANRRGGEEDYASQSRSQSQTMRASNARQPFERETAPTWSLEGGSSSLHEGSGGPQQHLPLNSVAGGSDHLNSVEQPGRRRGGSGPYSSETYGGAPPPADKMVPTTSIHSSQSTVATLSSYHRWNSSTPSQRRGGATSAVASRPPSGGGGYSYSGAPGSSGSVGYGVVQTSSSHYGVGAGPAESSTSRAPPAAAFTPHPSKHHSAMSASAPHHASTLHRTPGHFEGADPQSSTKPMPPGSTRPVRNTRPMNGSAQGVGEQQHQGSSVSSTGAARKQGAASSRRSKLGSVERGGVPPRAGHEEFEVEQQHREGGRTTSSSSTSSGSVYSATVRDQRERRRGGPRAAHQPGRSEPPQAPGGVATLGGGAYDPQRQRAARGGSHPRAEARGPRGQQQRNAARPAAKSVSDTRPRGVEANPFGDMEMDPPPGVEPLGGPPGGLADTGAVPGRSSTSREYKNDRGPAAVLPPQAPRGGLAAGQQQRPQGVELDILPQASMGGGLEDHFPAPGAEVGVQNRPQGVEPDILPQARMGGGLGDHFPMPGAEGPYQDIHGLGSPGGLPAGLRPPWDDDVGGGKK